MRKKRQTAAEQPLFLREEALPLLFGLLAVLLLLGNFGLCGAFGAVLRDVQLGLFGSPGLLFPLLLCGIVMHSLLSGDKERAARKNTALLLSYVFLIVLVHLLQGTEGGDLAYLYAGKRGGGAVGGLLAGALRAVLGQVGAVLIVLVLLILCLSYVTEKSFVALVQRYSGKAYVRTREELARRRAERDQREAALSAEVAARLEALEAEKAALEAGAPEAGNPGAEDSEAAETEKVPAPRTSWKKMIDAIQPDKQTAAEETDTLPREVIRTELTDDWEERRSARREFREEDEPEVLHFSRDLFPAKEPVTEEAPAVPPTPDMYADGDPALLEALRRADEILRRDDTPAEEAAVSQKEELYDEPTYDEPTYDEPVSFGAAYEAPETELSEVDKAEKLAQIEKSEAAEWNRDEEEEVPRSIEIAEAEPLHPLSFRTEETRVATDTSSVRTVQPRQETAARQQSADRQVSAPKKPAPPKKYKTPPLDLLEKGKEKRQESDLEYRTTALKLEETLHNFGVDVKVTNFSCGPAVTRYELLPAQGVKVGRIVALADDIKLSLAAADIRIEAPIPGKSAVGIEVPNKENNTVYLRDLLESERFKKANGKISFAVGKDIAGQTVVTDIAKMPHLLIAGATGSGKSVCINTLIMSILYRYRPEEVKLIMIDPKVVELSVYNGIPHLLIPVVTDPKKAAGALNWAVAEMTDRYRKFAETGVRDLRGYNERIRAAAASGTVNQEDLPTPLPQLVIIIDELADLMMVSKNEVEEAICRIAQLARAAGMHLVIATQRPSVNVITGLIKANIPSRIAFAVSSGIDSRTILDGVGAEKLLGKGDMLFFPQGIPKPVRVQGAFVSDQEVQKAVEFIREEEIPLSYSEEIEDKILRSGDSPAVQAADSGRDPLFFQAGRFVIEKNKASIGNLQRMFKIGFNRAARIMDQLAAAGVVGEEQGTKPRELLMSMEEFEAMEQ